MADRLAIAAGERLEVVEDTPEVLTVEACYAPRGNRPPAHYHPRQDEHFEVLEGSLRVQAGGVAIASTPYPRPGAPLAVIRDYFRGNTRAARVSLAGQLCSAAALARFTATVTDLARHPDTNSDALHITARAAGAAAVGSLATSALLSLALTGGEKGEATDLALHRWVFLAGGPVHTAAFGALVGCLSLAGRRTARLRDHLTTAGLVAATAGVLSPLSLITKPAVWLIPAGRMSGLAVTGIAGVLLSRPAQPRTALPDPD